MNDTILGLIIGIISSSVAGILLHFFLNKEHDTRIKIKVFDPTESYSSSNFYAILKKTISKAKEEVVQYAEGFNTEMPERHEKAKEYTDSIRAVLRDRPSVRWIRIQTLNPYDEGWLDLQHSLIKDFPSQFKLFLFNNRLGDHITSIVLIDPKTKKSKVFIMISKPRNLGGETKVNVTHTGVMIQGSRILSESLYDRLDSLLDVSKKHITTIKPDTDIKAIAEQGE
mgnify:CR=1 FL=1